MAETEQTSLEVQEKKALDERGERTVPSRYYVPYTDIHETADALSVVMEMPGVERDDVDIHVEDDVLKIEGRIDFSKYQDMRPVYTEYNVGHYSRSFTLSNKIDQGRISAQMTDGILTLTLPKAEETKPRKVQIN